MSPPGRGCSRHGTSLNQRALGVAASSARAEQDQHSLGSSGLRSTHSRVILSLGGRWSGEEDKIEV